MAGVNGFDVEYCPSDQIFDWLRLHGLFRVVCFYLNHAPGAPDKTWRPMRAKLAAKGWGFLPTYVGLQKNKKDTPDATKFTVAAARQHGAEAVKMMQDAGFASSSVLYLDLESGDTPTGAYATYVLALLDEVAKRGFTPALYCSHLFSDWAIQRTKIVWSFHVPKDTNGKTYDPDHLPGLIDPGCIATQYRQEIKLTGLTLPKSVDRGVDLDLCLVADPSNPAAVHHALGI